MGLHAPATLACLAHERLAAALVEVVEAHEVHIVDGGIVLAPAGDEEVERRELVGREHARRDVPDLLARLAQRRDERAGAVLAELAGGAVGVDPHLAGERDHDGQVEHLCERVAVGGDVVDAGGAGHEHALRCGALAGVAVAAQHDIDGILDQRAVAVGVGIGELVELVGGDLVEHGAAAEVGGAGDGLRRAGCETTGGGAAGRGQCGGGRQDREQADGSHGNSLGREDARQKRNCICVRTSHCPSFVSPADGV